MSERRPGFWKLVWDGLPWVIAGLLVGVFVTAALWVTLAILTGGS